MGHVYSLATQNLRDLLTILQYNVEHDIRLFRLSSDIFPFASHPEHGYSLDFADPLLKYIGDYAKKHGIRLTMHPGQFNVLSAEKSEVIKNTYLELNHHCDILDRMGMGVDSVMVIHGGGVYGNKTLALERLVTNIRNLPENTRNRLVLENCEMSYSVEDLLPVSELLRVPLVVDFHHDDIHGSSEPVEFYFDRVFVVWKSRGIKPKVHVSNSCPGVLSSDNKTKRRKHSDLIGFLHPALLTIDFSIDVMLEAKLKEQAVFSVRSGCC
jgi:UV DNA damage endonuclease